MKKLLSLIVAGTISLVLAGWALSQAPASLVRSGIIIGTAGAQSSVHGTATFNPSAGSIGSLVVTGCITGVTYTSAGTYAVALSGCPASYAVAFGCGHPSIVCIDQTNGTQSSSGFTMFNDSTSALYDPSYISVTIP
jgi:hypothetical protein